MIEIHTLIGIVTLIALPIAGAAAIDWWSRDE